MQQRILTQLSHPSVSVIMSASGLGRGKDHGKHPHKTLSSKKGKGVHVSNGLVFVLSSTHHTPPLIKPTYNMKTSSPCPLIDNNKVHALKETQLTSQKSIGDLVESLNSSRLRTLSDLRRIERVAMTSTPDAAAALHAPLTAAWTRYVTSNQLLLELRGMTRNYPLCSEIIHEAHTRALGGPLAGRSWNLAWLILQEMREEYVPPEQPTPQCKQPSYEGVADRRSGLITCFAVVEAQKPEMWAGRRPSSDEMAQLAACFEAEWGYAVNTMLRTWTVPPTWY